MKKIDMIALILLVIGGITWGIFGLSNFNIIDYVFGKIWIDKILYVLVGLSAIYALVTCKHLCCCKPKKQG